MLVVLSHHYEHIISLNIFINSLSYVVENIIILEIEYT